MEKRSAQFLRLSRRVCQTRIRCSPCRRLRKLKRLRNKRVIPSRADGEEPRNCKFDQTNKSSPSMNVDAWTIAKAVTGFRNHEPLPP